MYKGYTEAGKRAKQKYAAKTIRTVRIDLNRNTEPELIEWLESKKNISSYLKELIRKDMR